MRYIICQACDERFRNVVETAIGEIFSNASNLRNVCDDDCSTARVNRTHTLHSIGRVAERSNRPTADVRRVAKLLGVHPPVTLNDVPYFDVADANRIVERLAPSATVQSGRRKRKQTEASELS